MIKYKKKALKVIFISFFVLIIFFVIIGTILYFNVDKNIDLSFMRATASSITKIYYYKRDNNGSPYGEPIELKDEELFLNRNEWISYYNIPKNLVNAFIAIEDQHFFEHNGVDWKRTLKATFNYFKNFGKSEFGGSTITQQLIKNITGDSKQTPKRKIEEIIRAINIENNIGKFEILEMYLNIVYLSNNCYGVSEASHVFFGKEPADLTLAECASIASIVKSPSYYDPYHNPENNNKRRNIVLLSMYDSGMITYEEYEKAVNEPLNINSKIEEESTSGIYSWYTESLIDDIISDLGKKYNMSYEAALTLIYRGGLKIYTPIDPSVQKRAEEVFAQYKTYINHNDDTYPQASCVILDPYTSDILAIVGGVGIKEENRILNRATNTKRPLGSVIKPLSVFAPLIDKGIINYSTVFDDTPIITEDKIWPKNSPDVYHGLTDLEYGISHSLNTIAVKALNTLGKDNSFEFLRNSLDFADLISADKNDSPLALGQLTLGESLLKVTNAYSMFQNGGNIAKPRTYYEVRDSFDNLLLNNEMSVKRVISPDTSAIMNKLLKKVIDDGTGKGCELKNYVQVAGKTGTSGNNNDKWFIGYTPHYICGVWVGYDNPKPVVVDRTSPAIKLFDAIMIPSHLEKNRASELFSTDNLVCVEYCRDSGLLPCDSCRLDPRMNRINYGYFVKGTEPTIKCNIHKTVYIDAQTGKIANENTSYLLKRKISLLDYLRSKEYDSVDIFDKRYTINSRIAN